MPSTLYSENRDSFVKRTPLQSAKPHRMWAFTHSNRLRRWTAVRSRPRWNDEHAEEIPWDGFWQFVQKFFGYANRLLQQLSGWLVSDNLGSEDAGCGGPRLLWLHEVCSYDGLCIMLDIMPNSLKRLWRRLMLEKLTFNSWATALVGIPAVSMPITHSLKICDICGIVLCDKNLRVAFYCGQPKAHLCNNHAVYSASWYAPPVKWMDYLSK